MGFGLSEPGQKNSPAVKTIMVVAKAGKMSKGHTMKDKLLHPATIISIIALFVALSGSAYAVSQLPKNSVGNKQIRNNAVTSGKVKDGSLLSEDFKSGQLPAGPQGERGAQGERGIQGESGAPGEAGPRGQARAYAFVKSDGTVDLDRSSGFTGANLVKGDPASAAANGFYCITGLPFTVKSAIATSAYDTGSVVAAAPRISVQVADAGSQISVSSCTGLSSSDIQALVNTRDGSGNNANSAFVIWLED